MHGIRDKIKECCELEEVVDVVKRRNFRYFGNRGGGLGKEMMEGKVEARRGVGRPPANWVWNLKEWSGQSWRKLRRIAEDWEGWRRTDKDKVHPQPPRLLR